MKLTIKITEIVVRGKIESSSGFAPGWKCLDIDDYEANTCNTKINTVFRP